MLRDDGFFFRSKGKVYAELVPSDCLKESPHSSDSLKVIAAETFLICVRLSLLLSIGFFTDDENPLALCADNFLKLASGLHY